MNALRCVDGVSPVCSIHSVAIGEEIEHPFSRSIAFMWATLAASGTRDYARARERAEALLQLADRHSFPVWRGVAMVACGGCRAFAGETEFGLKLIGEGLVSQRQGGNGSWLRSTLVTAVAAHMQSGNLGRGLELLTLRHHVLDDVHDDRQPDAADTNQPRC